MPMSRSWAKNMARRVLWAAIEKDLSRKERQTMAAYFDHACAYCAVPLPLKGWHSDHLIPIEQGGYNHISNRVPSCAQCNEKEKREMDWEEFLSNKAAGLILQTRMLKIQRWQECHKPSLPNISAAQRKAWQDGVNKIAQAIDEAWNHVKSSTSLE